MSSPREPYFDKKLVEVIDEDDQSTVVPSDILDGTASDLSTWDTGNLEELASSGVLSSAELRAARLQKLARASQAGSKPKSKAKSKAEAPAVHEEPETTSAALRAARLQDLRPTESQKGAYPKQLTPAPAAHATVVPKAKPHAKRTARSTTPSKKQVRAATDMKAHLDKASREAISEMGLWEYMPARNPVVTRNTKMGADWHVSFQEYQHTLGGVPDAKPAQRPYHADELKLRLDIQSREKIAELGLHERMPDRNPVVTRHTNMGADWHISFKEYEHTLGGVPDSKPVERPHRADELHRHFDKTSREAINKMGLWEHTPANNPVVTKTSTMGSSWNISPK